MNVNVKVTLTDEERNKMHNRLTGTTTKKMVSRADVCEFVQSKIDGLLNGSFGTQTGRLPKQETHIEELDYVNCDVKELVKQNKLLLSRLNGLQYMIDTRGLKK